MPTNDPLANAAAAVRYARGRYCPSEAAMEFKRRRHPDKTVEPTEKDWELYRAADAALRAAQESDFIYIDGWVDEPRSFRTPGDYAETEDEYRARTNALAAEKGVPHDIHQALSAEEWATLVGGGE